MKWILAFILGQRGTLLKNYVSILENNCAAKATKFTTSLRTQSPKILADLHKDT